MKYHKKKSIKKITSKTKHFHLAKLNPHDHWKTTNTGKESVRILKHKVNMMTKMTFNTVPANFVKVMNHHHHAHVLTKKKLVNI